MGIHLKGMGKAFRDVGLDVQDGNMNFIDNKLQVKAQNLYSMAEVTVTAAQMLALNATPQTIAAAPGAGRALVFAGAALFLDYNSAAYAGIAAGEDLVFRYTDDSGAIAATVETTGFLDATADELRHVHPASTAAVEPVANSPLVLHLLSGEIITGDSPLKIRMFYHNIQSSW